MYISLIRGGLNVHDGVSRSAALVYMLLWADVSVRSRVYSPIKQVKTTLVTRTKRAPKDQGRQSRKKGGGRYHNKMTLRKTHTLKNETINELEFIRMWKP